MAMADGYAMASGKLGVVNVHICAGLGNAMGMLYNSFRSGTPLLLTAGQQDRRLQFEEPILWGDMLGVVRPWTKWAVEVQRVEDIPSAMRRAMQTALTPPTGPVFLSIPLDLQTASAEMDLSLSDPPDPELLPAATAIERAADVLLLAERPGILVGSRVIERGAVKELVAVAEQLGAPVLSEPGTTHGRLGFPSDHPLYAQGLPLWSPEIRERLAEFDTLLVVGMDLFRPYIYHEPARAMPEHIRLVHLDEDPYQLGKNYPLAAALLGSTKGGLAALAAELSRRMTAPQNAAARRRAEALAARHQQARESLRREARSPAASSTADAVGGNGMYRARVAEERGRRRRSGDDDQHDARTSRRDRRSVGLFWPSRLGTGMGTRLRDRRAIGVARAAGAGTIGRRRIALRNSRTVDGRSVSDSGHVRDLQQRSISDPQNRLADDEPAGRECRSISWHGYYRAGGRFSRPGPIAERVGGSRYRARRIGRTSVEIAGRRHAAIDRSADRPRGSRAVDVRLTWP